MAAVSEELLIVVKAEVDKAIKDLGKLEKGNKKMTNGFLDMAKKIAGPAAAGLIIKKLIDIGKEFSELSAAAEETENKFRVVFGNTAGSVKEWADTYSRSVGRSTSDTLDFLGAIGDLLKPLGFNKRAVDDLSKTVVTLANDMGSFNNLPTADVMRDIQSAMVGNYEVTKKYGVVLNESVIKQEALNQGLFTGKGALDAQTKAQVALSLIIKGTADAQGDLLRTQESATNVSRRLESAQKDLAIAIGNSINEGITPLKAVLADLTKQWADYIINADDARKIHDDITNGADLTSTSIENLNKELTDQQTILATLEQARKNSGPNKPLEDQITKQKQNIVLLEYTIKKIEDQKIAENIASSQRQKGAALDEQYAAAKIKSDTEKLLLAQELAEAESERAKKKAQIDAEQKILDEAYGKTLQGQIDKTKELIAEWESYVPSNERNIVLEQENKNLDILMQKQKDEMNAFKENWLTKEEIAEMSLGSMEEWLNEYYEKQAELEAADLQKMKDSYKEKLSIVSEFVGGFNSLFNQLATNEMTTIDNTEDAKIQSIKDSYDAQLALMDEDSKEYEDKEKEKVAAVKDAEDAKAALVRDAKQKQWAIDKAIAISQATIATLVQVTEHLGNPILAGAIGVLGAANVAAIAASPMPHFAEGGDFVTNGPQSIMVGDNPGGKERVTVEPLSSSNIKGPGTEGARIIINLEGQPIADFITSSLRNGDAQVYEGSIVQ